MASGRPRPLYAVLRQAHRPVATYPASATEYCAGWRATIVGTNESEVIRGTNKRDVIVSRGGDDRVLGLGGNDLICGGPGRDVLIGNAGNDTLVGYAGADRLIGGPGADRLFGSAGADHLVGGQGADLLVGNSGNDRLVGNSGYDRLFGELGTDHCRPGPDGGRRARCEVPPMPSPGPGILAIAWGDLDGDHTFGPDDVLISQLFDANADGIPSPEDTITMGKHPTRFAPTVADYAEWGVTSHTVTEVVYASPAGLLVETDNGARLGWTHGPTRESYREEFPDESHISDRHVRGRSSRFDPDFVQVVRSSPSQPREPARIGTGGWPRDDRFLDVEIYP